jgi:hypothetical protein
MPAFGDGMTSAASDGGVVVGEQRPRKSSQDSVDGTLSSMLPPSPTISGAASPVSPVARSHGTDGARDFDAWSSDRQALIAVGRLLHNNERALRSIEGRLRLVQLTVEGRTLFDLLLSFVFREGLGWAGDASSASFVDVAGTVFRTVMCMSVLMLCSRCVESMVRFLVGQVSRASRLTARPVHSL